jgi:hypothetical protein
MLGLYGLSTKMVASRVSLSSTQLVHALRCVFRLLVTANSSNTRTIPEDEILHSHRSEDLKPSIGLTRWALQLRSNVFPVRYVLGFYIPEDDILLNHCRNLT